LIIKKKFNGKKNRTSDSYSEFSLPKEKYIGNSPKRSKVDLKFQGKPHLSLSDTYYVKWRDIENVINY